MVQKKGPKKMVEKKVPKKINQPEPAAFCSQKWSNIAPTGCQNGAKNVQNRGQVAPRGAQMEPRWGQDGAKMGKKSENYIHPKKRWEALIQAPPF